MQMLSVAYSTFYLGRTEVQYERFSVQIWRLRTWSASLLLFYQVFDTVHVLHDADYRNSLFSW
jgi:hypothetical protein